MQSESNSSVITTLTENDYGDLVLDFPVELLQILGWKEGDSIEISTFAGRVIFTKLRDIGDRGTEAEDFPHGSLSEPNG
jgi:hypothetical protein